MDIEKRKKEGSLPPEEGDLNTQSISKGLTSEEASNLVKDLEAVESGRMSSDTIEGHVPALGRYDDRDFKAEDMQEAEDARFYAWVGKVREQGVTEEDASDELLDAIDHNLQNGFDMFNNARHFNNLYDNKERENKIRRAIETVGKRKPLAE